MTAGREIRLCLTCASGSHHPTGATWAAGCNCPGDCGERWRATVGRLRRTIGLPLAPLIPDPEPERPEPSTADGAFLIGIILGAAVTAYVVHRRFTP